MYFLMKLKDIYSAYSWHLYAAVTAMTELHV